MRLTLLWMVVGMLVGLGFGCSTKVEYYCDEDTPCKDRYPDRPFCDLTGEYPASEGVGRTCIPNPVDGGAGVDAPVNEIDAGDAAVGPDAQTNGTIVVTKDGTGMGLVVSTPGGINCGSACEADFPLGDTITLTATADASSDFVGWTSGICSGTSTCDAQAGDSVTATFDLKQEDLTVSRGGDGTGSVTATGIDCGTDCTETYDYGTMVTLTAAATGASSFGGWSGDGCSGTSPTCTVTMDQARTIGAAFDLNSFSLSVSLNGSGDGSVSANSGAIACPGTCSDSYTAGTMVTLTASPDGTSTFTGWSGACSGTSTCQVTMSAAHSVTATFARITYSLNVSKTGSGGGLITSSPTGINCGTDCSQSYTKGTSVVLTQSANPGSTFIGWSGGGCSGAGTTCTVSMTAARTVSAEFCAPVNDGIACTADSCDSSGNTVHTPNNAACQDGLYCNGQEICDTSAGCIDGPDPNLSDGVACTVDTCDEANDTRVNTPDNSKCDNGKFCDGTETCDATLGCLSGTPPVIDDGVSCTDDSCNETNGVVNTPNDANCADILYCNGDETCDPVNDCQPGTTVSCPPDDACKMNYTCNESTQTCVGTKVTHNISWSIPGIDSGTNFIGCSQAKTFYVNKDGCKTGVDWLYQCATDANGKLHANISGYPFSAACLSIAGPAVTSGCSHLGSSNGTFGMDCCFQ